MVGIREDTKENEEKAKVIPRAWRDMARMVSRLAEIKAEVMCCMSTTADTLNHQDPLFQGHGSQLTANEPHPYWPGFYRLRKGRGVRPILSTPGPARGEMIQRGMHYWLEEHQMVKALGREFILLSLLLSGD